MKFSLSWLQDHLEGETAADRLAARLTAVGFNVELREPDGADEVWDVDVTTNRPDAMNHRGLAREAAAAGCGALRPVRRDLAESAPPVSASAHLTVEDRLGCPRYCARVVRGVKVGPSPAWLAERLERCGIRSVNAVVDATNYVLLDLGQPLHAFDLARLSGGEIRVRRAAAGETVTTLDGVVRTLVPEDVVIADAARPVAVAGVMGGADSEIGDTTTDVLLESATFDPLSVRRTARRLGLSTEASHRFERGADPAMARVAVDAAAALIQRVAGGEVAVGVLDSAPDLPAPHTIAVDLDRLAAFTGVTIPTAFVERVLTELELAPRMDGAAVICSVPTHRVDLELAEDVFEEILRHYGYDEIPSEPLEAPAAPGARLGTWPLTDRARQALVAAGLAEAVTYSFVPEDVERAFSASPLAGRGDAVALENPLSARLAVLRRSVLGGLAEAAGGNLRRGLARVALAEVGRVFFADRGGVREEERLGVVVAGEAGTWDAPRTCDFLDLKGVVEALLDGLGIAGVSWRATASPVLAPGEGADVLVGDDVVAVAGRLADDAAALFDLPAAVWAAEIDLARASAAAVPEFEPLPKFPAVTADLTVRHALSLPYGELAAAVREVGPSWLAGIAPVVRYRGEGVAEGEVKTTLRLVYRHPDRSLTQEEVNEAHFALMEALRSRLEVSFS